MNKWKAWLEIWKKKSHGNASSSMEHMGILSALLPDIHINHLYMSESRANKMPMCMEYITSHLKS